MKSYEEDYDSKVVYDFFREEKWVVWISGYKLIRKGEPYYTPYLIYRIVLILYLLYLIAMSGLAAAFSFGNTFDMLSSVHSMLLISTAFTMSFLRLQNEELLFELADIWRTGFNVYEEEILKADHYKIKADQMEFIRSYTGVFTKIIAVVATSNSFIPLVKVIFVKEDPSGRVVNPFLPWPIYMPFDTSTVTGFIWAYVMELLLFCALASLVICADILFTSCTLQLKTQIVILNESLRDLEKRALTMLLETMAISPDEDKTHLDQMQNHCFYACIRTSIIHHQTIIKVYNRLQRFTGQILLMIVSLASLVMACHLVLMLKNPPPHLMANLVVTLISEVLFTFHFCWYGEIVITTSSEIYWTAYTIPWYKYDKKLKTSLLLLIMNSRNPLEFKTSTFNIPGSFNTFKSIISTMYQIMNVLRST